MNSTMTMTTPHLIYKELATMVEPTGRREIQFIASHELPDSESEIVLIDGLNLRRYSKNPLVLREHDKRQAVARTVSLTKQMVNGVASLVGKAVFPHEAESDAAYAKVKSGLLNGISIGFLSLRQSGPIHPEQRGVTHVKSELLEVSLVSLPACAECVIYAKAAQGAASLPGAKQQAPFTVSATELGQMVGKAVADATHQAVREKMMMVTGRVD
jgi:HK97 family phage prohead protease